MANIEFEWVEKRDGETLGTMTIWIAGNSHEIKLENFATAYELEKWVRHCLCCEVESMRSDLAKRMCDAVKIFTQND